MNFGNVGDRFSNPILNGTKSTFQFLQPQENIDNEITRKSLQNRTDEIDYYDQMFPRGSNPMAPKHNFVRFKKMFELGDVVGPMNSAIKRENQKRIDLGAYDNPVSVSTNEIFPEKQITPLEIPRRYKANPEISTQFQHFYRDEDIRNIGKLVNYKTKKQQNVSVNFETLSQGSGDIRTLGKSLIYKQKANPIIYRNPQAFNQNERVDVNYNQKSCRKEKNLAINTRGDFSAREKFFDRTVAPKQHIPEIKYELHYETPVQSGREWLVKDAKRNPEKVGLVFSRQMND
ncbi:hypothetical protein [Shrimp hemocyte iridescent virus]|uniref:Uncharacterized protein n=1 Tax=Shrimp hemocyte iridescent virus TaxID=2039780 RepID=A0A291B0K2_9VIRU|nr:hypothetical protein KM509_gp013 [Shrimp hemocyte iridescent virus]ATE87022.1 hypothetical protein [Shrimp hemocyte iridescent virus]